MDFTIADFFGFMSLGVSMAAGFFYPMAAGLTIFKAFKQN